jgi:hypothetical protein
MLACGASTQTPTSEHESMGGAASAGAAGNASRPDVVLAPEAESLPVCDEPNLKVASASNSTENWTGDQLLFPTSWHTYRGYAMRGPIDAITGVWATGAVSAPFVDREIRPLSSALLAVDGQLRCAAGKLRALRNGPYAALELTGLGPLTCSGDTVPGQLRYCHDCHQGGRAITGELDGETVTEVTGSHARVGNTLFLQMGWGVLIAHFAPDGDGETLRDGAYLSFSNQVYCFDSASGDASDGSTADITFSSFRHAGPCRADDASAGAQACVKQFEPGRDW